MTGASLSLFVKEIYIVKEIRPDETLVAEARFAFICGADIATREP